MRSPMIRALLVWPILLWGMGFSSSVQFFPGSGSKVYTHLLFAGDTLWMGTEGGLRWLDTTTGRSGWVSTADGMPTNHILGLALDTNGDLMVGASRDASDRLGWIGRRQEGRWTIDSVSSSCPISPTQFTISRDGTQWFLYLRFLYWRSLGSSKWDSLIHEGVASIPGRMIYAEPESQRVWYSYDISLCRAGQNPRCFKGASDGRFSGVFLRSMTGGGNQPLYVMNLIGGIYRWDPVRDDFDSIAIVVGGDRMTLDRHGKLWVGTRSRGLWTVDSTGIRQVRSNARSYSHVIADSLGRIWTAGYEGGSLMRIEEGRPDTLLLERMGDHTDYPASGFVQDGQGIVWWGSSYFNGSTWMHVPGLGVIPWYASDGTRFALDVGDNPDFSTGHMIRFDGKAITHYLGVQASSYIELAPGRVLAAAETILKVRKAFFLWDGATWKQWTKPDSVPEFDLYRMQQLDDTSWVAGSFLDGSRVPIIYASGRAGTTPLLPGRKANALIIDRDGIFWYSNEDTIWSWDGRAQRRFMLPPRVLNASELLHDWRDGGIWMATGFPGPNGIETLCKLKSATWTCITERDGYPGVRTFPPFIDSHGEAWSAHPAGMYRFTAPSAAQFYDTLQLWPEYPFPRDWSSTSRTLAPRKDRHRMVWLRQGKQVPAAARLFMLNGQPVRQARVPHDGVYVVMAEGKER